MSAAEAPQRDDERASRPTAPSKRGFPWLLALLALAVAPRVAILATGQRWLRSDEALVGIQAKHVITKARPVWFLAGQPYGGGHAMLAYALAPAAAGFGPRAWLVNGAPMALSLVNVALLWLLLRHRVKRPAAGLATALYAVAPAVMYQSFLANGGGFAFLLGLLSLHAFVRVGPEQRRTAAAGFALGLTCGLAIYAMDYAVVYPLTYALLFVLLWRGFFRSRAFPAGIAGGVIGLAPLWVFNLTHDWAHVRHMLRTGASSGPPPLLRFADALGGFLTQDGPALFTTRLDDFGAPIPWGAWLHFAVFLVALAVVASATRKTKAATGGRAIELVALSAVGVYFLIYGFSGFSDPRLKTPRYFIPLYPFVPILVGAALSRAFLNRRAAVRVLAGCVFVALVAQSLAEDRRMTDTAGHEEHRVLTSGRSVAALARWLGERDIRHVFTRYEIQMRLVAMTNERVLASCVVGPGFLLSPLPRYPEYDLGTPAAVADGSKPFAFVFRRDFAFGRLWPDRRAASRRSWERWLRSGQVRWKTRDVGEFIVYYDFSPPDFLRR